MSGILVSEPWHCHDGWASSVSIIRAGQTDYDTEAECRKLFHLWHRSASTRVRALERQRQRIAVAVGLTGLPVVHEGTEEHKALFSKSKVKPHRPLWHVASTGDHQGLIIDERDGRNVAVTYDRADAPLIAAAPELLSALELCAEDLRGYQVLTRDLHTRNSIEAARAAIAKATAP